MKHNEQRLAGVWVDHKNAFIIAKDAGQFAVKERIDAPGGFEAESEHHRNNAKQADLLSYFKSLSGHLQHYDQILLFGTGIAQEQLNNFLKEDAKFKDVTITIENTGHLTDPQMLAKVRTFFN